MYNNTKNNTIYNVLVAYNKDKNSYKIRCRKPIEGMNGYTFKGSKVEHNIDYDGRLRKASGYTGPDRVIEYTIVYSGPKREAESMETHQSMGFKALGARNLNQEKEYTVNV